MAETQKKTASAEKVYLIHTEDLPLSCPTNDMILWNAHPKIYLPIEKSGQEVCPYCGTRFILQRD